MTFLFQSHENEEKNLFKLNIDCLKPISVCLPEIGHDHKTERHWVIWNFTIFGSRNRKRYVNTRFSTKNKTTKIICHYEKNNTKREYKIYCPILKGYFGGLTKYDNVFFVQRNFLFDSINFNGKTYSVTVCVHVEIYVVILNMLIL